MRSTKHILMLVTFFKVLQFPFYIINVIVVKGISNVNLYIKIMKLILVIILSKLTTQNITFTCKNIYIFVK